MKTLSSACLLITIFLPATYSQVRTEKTDSIKQEQASGSKREPTVVMDGPLGVVSTCLAADGEVYWLDDDKTVLLHINTKGAAYPAPLLRTNTRIETFTVDDTGIYYVSQNKMELLENASESALRGELRRVDKKGQSSTSLVPDIDLASSTFVATDPTHVYFFSRSNTERGVIFSIPKKGGETMPLASKITAAVSESSVDDKNLYWLDRLFKSVLKVDKRGGIRTTVFSNREDSFEPQAMIGDEKYLYLVTRKNAIYQISKENGKARQIFAGSFQFYGTAIAVAGDFVYWHDNNRIFRLRKTEDQPTTLSVSTAPTTCITSDDKYIYWFEMAKGLMKLEK